FQPGRPVLLTLNYSDCPMLCSLQLTGLVKTLSKMEWTAGDRFQVVTVSINPNEGPERAKLTQAKYLKEYGRPATDGWVFLTGRQPSIETLAKALGFGYQLQDNGRDYSHAAVVFVATPEGKLSRYLYGIDYDPQTVKLSLVEAADGKIGTTIDKILLFCFHYDATKGRYGPAARNLMKLGGAVTLVVMGVVGLRIWRFERRRGVLTTVAATGV
ncbi:MAG: SCO family protein, partial [Planctomycetia bacterium]